MTKATEHTPTHPRIRHTGNVHPVFIILIVLAALIGTTIYWQSAHKSAQRTETQRAEAAVQEAKDKQASIELKALEQQISAAKTTDPLQTSLKAADDLYARWKDGKQVANLTSRIGLATPVATLQALRRETEALIVPDCLKRGKTDLLAAMTLEIEGFLAFMSDVNIGKLVAQANADNAEKLLTGFEADRKMCPTSPNT